HGLIESEMFGYEDGAFTGASRGGRPGKFELADQGTLFLDEIGDMPLHLQASLLRALQFKEVVRVGGNRVIPVDVRIIAATNQNLMEKVREGSFRSDLYFRLNVFPLNLPALRDRKEDIPFLVDAFIRESGSWVDAISESALVALEKYDWPGNVRELQNVIDRATNLAASKCITEKDLPSEIFEENSNAALQTSYFVQEEKAFVSGSPHMTRSAEEDDIRAALQRTGGNVSRASSVLGIPRKTLYRKIEAYHIDLSPFRSGLL
ncbi:MAG: sigma 54-interacting transcriptional regulator, partial [Firmicutes bacterium]|nr:sigma 54-interacting transcriptional regulator [Bacillota bacterium]